MASEQDIREATSHAQRAIGNMFYARAGAEAWSDTKLAISERELFAKQFIETLHVTEEATTQLSQTLRAASLAEVFSAVCYSPVKVGSYFFPSTHTAIHHLRAGADVVRICVCPAARLSLDQVKRLRDLGSDVIRAHIDVAIREFLKVCPKNDDLLSLRAAITQESNRAIQLLRQAPPESPSEMNAPTGWTFTPGKATYNGVEFQVSGVEAAFLRRFVEARRPLRYADLRELCSRDDQAVDGTVRKHVAQLRKTLRKALKLGTRDDPLPCVAKGSGQGAWELKVENFPFVPRK